MNEGKRNYGLKPRALVTGGAGFLGSHLCEQLLQKNFEVICLDNFFTGTKANIRHLLEHPDFEVMRHDVCEPISLEVDEIYNLACPASPVHYQHDPVQTTRTCVIGSLNMLQLAQRNKAKIFQASTSEVYGSPEVHPQKEEYWGRVNPVGLRSCYDEGKRCAETLFSDYKRQYGVDVRIARIFNTYGPRMHPNDGRVVSNFIVQALSNKPITIYGAGAQTRSFCYVDDLIAGIMALRQTDNQIDGPINIGNPHEISVFELASLVIEMTGSRSELLKHPLPSDDPLQRCPDISQAAARLGWRPRVDLRRGLEQTIAYFESQLTGSQPDMIRPPMQKGYLPSGSLLVRGLPN